MTLNFQQNSRFIVNKLWVYGCIAHLFHEHICGNLTLKVLVLSNSGYTFHGKVSCMSAILCTRQNESRSRMDGHQGYTV